MALSKEQRKRVYERVVGRYRRLAKKLGKNWKEVSIDGKSFQDAYEFEQAKEEELIEKGEESRLRRSRKESGPEIILRELEQQQPTPRRKRRSALDWLANPSDAREMHGEKCNCRKCVGAFGSEEDLVGIIPESDERRAERKEFEAEVNRQLEAICTERICPRCRSSVCHCEED